VTAEIIVSADSGVGAIRIERPAKKNAITTAMYAAISDALETFDRDDAVRVVTLLGGADFSAGNDLRDFIDASASGETDALDAIVEFLTRLCDFSKPLVAGVRGNAVGIGTTMLLHTDVVVAGTSARFRLPFTQLGLVPEAGSSLLLPLVVGRMRAAWMLLAGEFFSADEAYAAGLVTRVVADDCVDETAQAIAAHLAALPPIALRETKRLMREAIAKDVRGQMDEEVAAFSERLNSEEFRTRATKTLTGDRNAL
jgi:enoyl-CoA hydratase/carnithine racemase